MDYELDIIPAYNIYYICGCVTFFYKTINISFQLSFMIKFVYMKISH